MRTQSIVRLWGIGDVIVWSFRLERLDESDNPLPVISVELRGPLFDGMLRDGDEIEVKGRLQNGVLHATSILNLSTSPPSLVRSRGNSIRSALVAFGLTATALASICTLLTTSGLIGILLSTVAERNAVVLSNCFVTTKFAELRSRPMLQGVTVGRYLSTLPIDLRAHRRADIWFGASAEFEVEQNGQLGWLQGAFIDSFEGDCLNAGLEGVSVPTPTPDPDAEAKNVLFPDIDANTRSQSRLLPDNCTISLPFVGRAIPLYELPTVFNTQQLGGLPEGTYSTRLFFPGEGGWYFVRTESTIGWIQQLVTRYYCGDPSENPFIISQSEMVATHFAAALPLFATQVAELNVALEPVPTPVPDFAPNAPCTITIDRGARFYTSYDDNGEFVGELRNYDGSFTFPVLDKQPADDAIGLRWAWYQIEFRGQPVWVVEYMISFRDGDCDFTTP